MRPMRDECNGNWCEYVGGMGVFGGDFNECTSTGSRINIEK